MKRFDIIKRTNPAPLMTKVGPAPAGVISNAYASRRIRPLVTIMTLVVHHMLYTPTPMASYRGP